ncbi:hypothetical protein E2C01_092461 [Portunus trituberculatus]|uniref:Uncharacterized protein n=1 Tax=Portunus trituberculatus TaxID=210409 RepID=A0A5B7JS44_PORTR|nr:hypothetical protein [Portunus trituberculatus]
MDSKPSVTSTSPATLQCGSMELMNSQVTPPQKHDLVSLLVELIGYRRSIFAVGEEQSLWLSASNEYGPIYLSSDKVLN